MDQVKKIQWPYFVVGERVYRHWPDSTPEAICDGEKQYGPDFVERYSTRKAAQKDADTMNRAYMLKWK
jgi:hypothetical protein